MVILKQTISNVFNLVCLIEKNSFRKTSNHMTRGLFSWISGDSEVVWTDGLMYLSSKPLKQVVDYLRKRLNMHVVLLTGDNQVTAKGMAFLTQKIECAWG